MAPITIIPKACSCCKGERSSRDKSSNLPLPNILYEGSEGGGSGSAAGCVEGLCPHRGNDSLHFVRRSAPSKCVRCGTSSILLSPTIMKSSTCSAPWDFLLPFPSHLIYHLTPCIRAHDHLRVALLLQMMFAAEPVRSCYRPPE